MFEMIDLIKIVREKALNDILYANARLSVCNELIEMCEERAKATEKCQNPDVDESVEEVAEAETEDKPQDNLTFNF